MPTLQIRLTNDQIDILQACVGMGASMTYIVDQRKTFPFLRDLAKELDEIIRDSFTDGSTPILSNHPAVTQLPND